MSANTDFLFFKCIRKRNSRDNCFKSNPTLSHKHPFLSYHWRMGKKKWEEGKRRPALSHLPNSRLKTLLQQWPKISSTEQWFVEWTWVQPDRSGDQDNFSLGSPGFTFQEMQHWHKKYRTNQNQMKTRPRWQRKDRSVGTQTSLHSFSAVKPVMLKALRGNEETLPRTPCVPQPQHSTAGLEGNRCPPAFAGGDTITLQKLPCSEGVQTRRQVLIKQNGQVGSFWLDLSPVNPAAHWRIPAQISWVDVQDPFRPRVRKKTSWGHSREHSFPSAELLSNFHTTSYTPPCPHRALHNRSTLSALLKLSSPINSRRAQSKSPRWSQLHVCMRTGSSVCPCASGTCSAHQRQVWSQAGNFQQGPSCPTKDCLMAPDPAFSMQHPQLKLGPGLTCSGHGCWRGCAQVADLKDQPHRRVQRDSLIACQGQHLHVADRLSA